MKTKLALLLLFVAHLCISQTAPSMKIAGIYAPPPPPTFGEDPNLNPDWDWINGDVQPDGYPRYVIYFQDQPRSGEEWQYLPPWLQGDSWPGLLDRFKEDGWILLARDFGSPTRRIGVNGNVYFALYNKYRSVLRVFYLIQKAQQNFQYAMMALTWRQPDSKITGSLTSLTEYCEALDKVLNSKDNATMSVLSADPLIDNWVYADFPLVLDDVYKAETTVNPPSLLIKITGITDVQLQMVTEGFGAEGDADFIKNYMTGNPLGSVNFSMNRFDLPGLGIKDFNIGVPKLSGTQVDWNAVREFFKNIKFRIPNLGIGNPFKGLFDGYKDRLEVFQLALPFDIAGIDLAGLYNYFSGGGMKVNYVQTAPTYTSFQTYAQGSLTSSSSLGTLTIPMPATRPNFKESFEGGEIGLCVNDRAGILTLKKTPVVYLKRFEIVLPYDCSSIFNTFMAEYEIAEQPQITLNANSGLELKKCEVSMVAPLYWQDECQKPEIEWIVTRISGSNQRYLVDFEAPINEQAGYVKSLPVPLQLSKGRTLQLPYRFVNADVKLKIKATLQRKDDPNAQPVVFIATYNVDVVERNDLPTEQPLPLIPPQDVSAVSSSDNQVALSWSANLEKSVSSGGGYNVYRDIYYGTTTLATTKLNSSLLTSTTFTDNTVNTFAVPAGTPSGEDLYARYRVVAVSSDGTVSPSSNSSSGIFIGRTITGTLSSDISMSDKMLAFGTITVNSTPTFPASTILTVREGSIMRFASATGLIINGTIIAQGASGNPISFTSATGTTPASWNYVMVQNGNNVFKYCTFRYAIAGLYLYNATAGTPTLVENCTFQNNTYGIIPTSSKAVFKSCDISYNMRGVQAYACPELRYIGNHIHHNTDNGVFTYTGNSSYFYGNSIEYNGVCGIITSTADIIHLGQPYTWEGKNTIRYNSGTEIYAVSGSPNVMMVSTSVHDASGYEILNTSGNPQINTQNCFWDANGCQYYGPVSFNVSNNNLPAWDGQWFTSGSPLGKTSTPEIPDDAPWIVDPRISDAEKVKRCKEILRADINSDEAKTTLGWLYSLVRLDFVENNLGEKEKFFRYLQQIRASGKDTETGKLALRYMIVWKMLENDLGFVISLSKAAMKEMAGDERKLAVADLARTYARRGQIKEANSMVRELKLRHAPDKELIEDIERFIKSSELLIGQGTWKKVENESDENIQIDIPIAYALQQNYPNPFNPVTTINYQIPKDGMVILKVYDMLGREVQTLVNEYKTAGYYRTTFDASGLSSGMYIYRLVSHPAEGGASELFTAANRMLLVK